MVSLRVFAGIVSAVMIIAAGLALLLPIDVAESVSCGPAVAVDTSRAAGVDRFENVRPDFIGGRPDSNLAGACQSAASSRRAWAIPAGILGVVVLAGVVLVRGRDTMAA